MKKLITLVLLVVAASCLFAEKKPQKVNVSMPFSKGINLGNLLCDYGTGNVNSCYLERQDFEDIQFW